MPGEDDKTKGGVSATHEPEVPFAAPVAPSTTGKEKNTLRMELIPVACWRLNDLRFDFGSSFVLPESKSEFDELAALRKEHAGAGLSVFGHADPVSDDAFNKRLSDHRSESIYAVLLHDTDRWEKLYSSAGSSEGWGTGAIQHMLKAAGEDPGPVTGAGNAQTTAAVKSFQTKNGLTSDGVAGKNTRAKLFAAYMKFLWPVKLEKTDFLFKGADAGGKGDFQGCGEFNPVMVFSKAEAQAFTNPAKKGERDEQNGVNRRVMVLLFRPGITVPVAKWPCPRTGEGTEACRKRFWSDGDKRRGNQDARREFKDTQDTFACRFYHRLVVHSPCDGGAPAKGALVLLSVDDHFCPKQEKLDIVYSTRGFSGKKVTLTITGKGAPGNPIFEKELTDPEKSDGKHTFQWDGKATSAAPEWKDKFIHPLFSPYTVTLRHDDANQGSLDFKVLYHSIELKQGPQTPDEVEPPEGDDQRFVAHKLNELGYWGGPVEKDVDDYLKKAIIRYKANHAKFRKTFIGDYDDTITADLKAALKAKENDRKFGPLEAITDPAKTSKLMVESLTYERTGASADEFGTTRPPKDKLRLNRPLVPVEATIFLKKKDDSKADEPEAVGPARISWTFTDTDEDLTPQFDDAPGSPSRTKRFIEQELKQHGGRAGKGDNCPEEFGGIRDDADNFKTAFLLGDNYVPHEVKEDSASKSVFSLAAVDKAKFPKRLGKAGVMLRPSFIAGDDYQYKAELDFTGLPNKADLEKFHGITADEKTRIQAKTGKFTVRRFNRLATIIDWPGRKSPLAAKAKVHLDEELGKIETEFEKAFNDFDTKGMKPQKMSAVITEAEYKDLVAANTKHTDKSKIKLLDDCLVGVDIPAQGNRNADDYKTFLATFTADEFNSPVQTPLGELLSKKIRPKDPSGFIVVNFLAHKPIDIQTDPANGKTDVSAANKDFVHWAGSIGLADSVILADMKDPDLVYYVISHEMGHNFYLLHWENTGENNTKNHDQSDHNCSMSYSTSKGPAHQKPGVYAPHFCGKCNLALRGWDVTSANLGDKSKTKGSKAPAGPPAVFPVITAAKREVLVRKKHTETKRIPVELKTDVAFDGTGTITRSSDAIKIFAAETGGTELKFNGKKLSSGGNTIPGATLTGGVKVFVEGAKGSAAKDDVELELSIKGGSKVPGPAVKVKLTAVEVTLDIFGMKPKAGDAEALTEKNKVAPGRAMHLQNAAGKRARAKVVVRECKPATFAEKLELRVHGTGGGTVKLFDAETKGTEVALPHAFDANKVPKDGKVFFLEGTKVSGALSDTGLEIGLQGDAKPADFVTATVIEAKLAICDPRTAAAPAKPAEMTDVKKLDPGRILGAQDKDKTQLRARVVVKQVTPAAFKGKLKVRPATDAVELFEVEDPQAKKKNSPLKNPHEVDAAKIPADGLELFAEGKKVSTKAMDTGVLLDVDGVDEGVDEVKITCIEIKLDKLESTSRADATKFESDDDFAPRLGEKLRAKVKLEGPLGGFTGKVRIHYGRLNNKAKGTNPMKHGGFSLAAENDTAVNIAAAAASPQTIDADWDGKATANVALEFSARKTRDRNTNKDVNIPVGAITSGSFVPHGLYVVDQISLLNGSNGEVAKLRPVDIGLSVPILINLQFNANWAGDLTSYGLSAFSAELQSALLKYGERDFKVNDATLTDRINVRMISNAGISNANSIRVSVGGPDPAAGGLFGSTPVNAAPTDNMFAIREGLGSDITAFPSTFFLFNAGGGSNAAVDQPLFRGLFNPLGVANGATVAAPGAASARAIDGAGKVTGATTALDSGNVTVTLAADGIPSVVSTDVTKVPAARAADIQAAMRAFVRFVGNTINHEAAHGLGAVGPNDAGNKFNVAGKQVRSPLNGDNGAHNKVTANTNILDSGGTRSFARRIENTGVQQVFNATNARYLADVVPHDPTDD